jgi:hypothetical protein
MANTVEYIYEVLDRFSGPLKNLEVANKKVNLSMDRVRSSAANVRTQFASLAKAGALVGAAGMAVGYAMFRVAKEAADLGDAAFKTSQKIGMNIEKLQEVSWAAKLAGVEQGELNVGLRMLNVNMTEAARGSKEYLRQFRLIGLNAKDLKNMSMDQVLLHAAEAFSKMEDGAQKTAIAVRLFGRSGASMIPLLNQGEKGFAAAAEEARRLGIIIDEETARKSEEFNDNLTRLENGFRGIRIMIGNAIIPIFNELTLSMSEFLAESRDDIVSGFRVWIGYVKENLPKIKSAITDFGMAIYHVARAINWAAGVVGGFGNALKIIAAIIGIKILVSVAMLVKAIFGLGAALGALSLGPIVAGFKFVAIAAKAATIAFLGLSLPVIAIIGGVALLAAGIAALVIYWDDVTAAMGRVYQKILPLIEAAKAFMNTGITGLLIRGVGGAINLVTGGGGEAENVAARREAQSKLAVDGGITVSASPGSKVETSNINLNGGNNLATAY